MDVNHLAEVVFVDGVGAVAEEELPRRITEGQRLTVAVHEGRHLPRGHQGEGKWASNTGIGA